MSDGIKGTIPCELFGGPLDGVKYGDLPDTGHPMTGCALSVPLGQPAVQHPHAVYVCTGDAPVDGLWQFHYVRTAQPAHSANARVDETPVGTQLTAAGHEVAS